MCKVYGYINQTVSYYSGAVQKQGIVRFNDGAIIIADNKGSYEKLARIFSLLKRDDRLLVYDICVLGNDVNEVLSRYMTLLQKNVTLVVVNDLLHNNISYRDAFKGVKDMKFSSDEIQEEVRKAVRLFANTVLRSQIEISFIQNERKIKLRSDSIKRGMTKAQLDGKQSGSQQQDNQVESAKAIRAKNMIARLSRDFYGSLNDRECQQIIGISRNTYYKYKRELAGTRKKYV